MTTFLRTKRILGLSARDVAPPAISGLLLTLCFPRIDWEFLAWVALVPLFFSIQGKSPKEGFKRGFVMGLVHYSTLLYWIAGVMKTYGHLPVVLSWTLLLLLVAYMSLYPAAFSLVMCQFRLSSHLYWFIAPFLWTSLEYIRAFLLSGFPWEHLGYSQYERLHLIQISDILGVYGVSALIVAVNAALFECTDGISRNRSFSWKAVLAIAFLLAGVLVYGTWRVGQIDRVSEAAPKTTVALAQGNIDQSVKWAPSFQHETLERYERLSFAAAKSRPDLIVWPETALPFYFLYDPGLTAQVIDLVRACQTHFIVGSPSFQRKGQEIHYYNSAYLLGPSGDVLGKYDKVHLVPYGEYVPLKRFLPFLGKIAEAAGDFEAGVEGQVLALRNDKLGVLVCFEVIFPGLSRMMVRNGAHLLINITNDAWFGTSSAPYQHLSMAVFRAVENHRAVARAANTGISAFIDPAGRFLDKTSLCVEAVRLRSLPVMHQRTFYTQHGDLFAMVSVLISLVLCIGVYGKAWLLKSRRIGNSASLNGE